MARFASSVQQGDEREGRRETNWRTSWRKFTSYSRSWANDRRWGAGLARPKVHLGIDWCNHCAIVFESEDCVG